MYRVQHPPISVQPGSKLLIFYISCVVKAQHTITKSFRRSTHIPWIYLSTICRTFRSACAALKSLAHIFITFPNPVF
ncbi:hypothetical protein UPYG_G00007390 [Umbra pygmaea]|uniref:Uncharacterized protein n=1 Tax=Umbra pygmaea TaxID=75934 RepID=A0ABD0XI12_UMBPY